MDAHAEKIHSIMNLILNKPSLFIFTMLFDFFSALFSTISSVRLALFTQNVIEGKYIEAIQVELVNLILFLIAVFADYLYHVLQNKTIQSGMIVYRDMISNSLVHRLSEASDKRCYEKKYIMRSRTRKFFFMHFFVH